VGRPEAHARSEGRDDMAFETYEDSYADAYQAHNIYDPA
jgi:hypothetical protein